MPSTGLAQNQRTRFTQVAGKSDASLPSHPIAPMVFIPLGLL